MSDEIPFGKRSDAEILAAMKLESKGLRKAIAAIEAAGEAMDAADKNNHPDTTTPRAHENCGAADGK